MARYLANKNKKEIHDLKNEQVNCQINEIKLEHKVPLQTIEDVERWIKKFRYNGCKWCLNRYHTD